MKRHILERPADLLKHAPESIVSLVNDRRRKDLREAVSIPSMARSAQRVFSKVKGPQGLDRREWPQESGIFLPLRVMAYVEQKDGFGIKESFLLMEASEQGHGDGSIPLKGI